MIPPPTPTAPKPSPRPASRPRNRWGWRLAAVAALSTSAAGAAAAEPDGPVQFNRDVRPILVSNCLSCHGGVKQQGGISFVYADQVLPPDGWAVEPGDPDASPLIERVEMDDPDLRMPPPEHGPPLTPREVDVLRRWIAEGASWQDHWAFEPPVEPPLPGVNDQQWPREDLDRYVLARREQEGLASTPDAPPYRWLRRASLDLTGLPPTPAQRRRFLSELESDGEAAYQQAADRLLASPHYGERWASVWLDQVRYADSMGLGLDSPRSVWQYRDWVIRSLNADLPYDQFTVKQIAGDLLPGRDPDNLVATACQRLTQSNEEGGTDDEEFRVAAVLDRVNTTWQAWQGMTFGCVQCHSHPYEPFRHEDYYRFTAFFNNTADSDLDDDAPTYRAPNDPADNKQAEQLDEEIRSLGEQIWAAGHELLSDEQAWRPLTGLTASANNATRLQVERAGDHDEFFTVGTIERGARFTLEAPLPADLQPLTAIRGVVLPGAPETARADSEWGFVWSRVEAELVVPSDEGEQVSPLKIARIIGDEPHPLFSPQASLDKRSRRGFSALSRIYHPRSAALVLEQPAEVPPGARLRLRIAHDVQMVGAFSLVSRRGHLAVSDRPGFTALLTAPALAEQRRRLGQLTKQRRAIPSTATPVMQERPAHLARESHVFERGLFLDKGPLVTPGVPESMPELPAGRPADRLALAQWLASPDNPLTARVAVNRVWARVFGAGLVETEEDFGSSGEPPSHPQLLDYLALRFQGEHGWRFKPLLRELILSSTYRQSEVATPAAKAADPANRLLSRGPRVRLPSEAVRDQALALAGLLSDQMYGPPVRPPLPEGVWRPFAAGDKWPAPEPGSPQRYRRSIYTYTKRSIPFPTFATFDQPSREFCAPRRLRSNTPLQALEVLNSEAFHECSVALAERMAGRGEDPREQVRWGFELVTCRPPTDSESDVLVELFEHPDGGGQAVAAALLNLDEVLMK
ncbi:Planctomycete cytochrome C [Posidoniimonas corsicana]|uniref:Planctomycete cytochrome C n=1 Tax=Posidoniimonas corsicana TaxID=1938618 RepID=A0A5C5VD14_9BACT|nr:PSD1 and planctomycete cytochrome C domain-containing protein [Posidoniimonas corsicana]TWT36486.1 Planctomycete cytochrome C [Posidoniimonas corsicana]